MTAALARCLAQLDALLQTLPAAGLCERLPEDNSLRIGLRMSAGEVEEAPKVLEIGQSLTGAPSKTKESKLGTIETAFG